MTGHIPMSGTLGPGKVRTMRTMPNKSILEGVVRQVTPADDGHGADIEFVVDRAETAEGYADFIRPADGATLHLFAAEPGEFHIGGRYRVTATVLGGPMGERSVVETARPID
jgi:hypothetical protein